MKELIIKLSVFHWISLHHEICYTGCHISPDTRAREYSNKFTDAQRLAKVSLRERHGACPLAASWEPLCGLNGSVGPDVSRQPCTVGSPKCCFYCCAQMPLAEAGGSLVKWANESPPWVSSRAVSERLIASCLTELPLCCFLRDFLSGPSYSCLYKYLCMYLLCMSAHVYVHIHMLVELRRQIVGVGLFLIPCGFLGLSSTHPAWQQEPLPD